mgnify:CR=1 FL=1
MFGVTKFKQYVDFTEFDLVTDHSALTWMIQLTSTMTANARVNRWSLALAGYNYKLKYRRGTKHGDADFFSRNPVGDAPEVDDCLDIQTYPGTDEVRMKIQ